MNIETLQKQNADLLLALRDICDMQARHYGDGMSTHLALIELTDKARPLLVGHSPAAANAGDLCTGILSMPFVRDAQGHAMLRRADVEKMLLRPAAVMAGDLIAEGLKESPAHGALIRAINAYGNARSLNSREAASAQYDAILAILFPPDRSPAMGAGSLSERAAALVEAAVIAEKTRFAMPASPTERAFNTGIESAVRCIRAAITAPRPAATKTGSPT